MPLSPPRFALPLLLLAGLLAGCGDGGPDVVSVSGTITRQGKPVPNAKIIFQPTQGRTSVGYSDAEGKYKLRYTREQEGAKLGTHKVIVVSQGGVGPEAEIAIAQGKTPDAGATIAAKYAKVETTPLTVEVKGDGAPIPLEIE